MAWSYFLSSFQWWPISLHDRMQEKIHLSTPTACPLFDLSHWLANYLLLTVVAAVAMVAAVVVTMSFPGGDERWCVWRMDSIWLVTAAAGCPSPHRPRPTSLVWACRRMCVHLSRALAYPCCVTYCSALTLFPPLYLCRPLSSAKSSKAKGPSPTCQGSAPQPTPRAPRLVLLAETLGCARRRRPRLAPEVHPRRAWGIVRRW